MGRSELGLEQLWDRFDNWSELYIAKCDSEIERLAAAGDYWNSDVEFMAANPDDVRGELDIDVAMHKAIIRRKVAFLRVYFRDLSFDGAAFLKRHMRLLPLQLPLRKRNGIGVWLIQDEERKELTPNASTEFLEPCVSLFATSISDIDFSSAHNVLPFDFLFIQNFSGKKWTRPDARRIAKEIEADLRFDGMEFEIGSALAPHGLNLTFIWNPADPPTLEDAPLATAKTPTKKARKPTKQAAPKKGTATKAVAKRAKPKQNFARVRGARRDASIATITKRIQKAFKLPDGSVRLLLPSGKKAHIDGRIKNLLAQWDGV